MNYIPTIPTELRIDPLKWKYMMWAAKRGENVLLIGPTGCGKTKTVGAVATALNREDKYFSVNIGQTSDAKTTLIGNTHFDKSSGTYFNESQFVKAIRTPGTIILLDELSRGSFDAWNIILTVIDPVQRFLRLDEKKDSEVVKVAEGVLFFATANVGLEYTSAKIMDKALLNRFTVKIEMPPMMLDDEFSFLKEKYNITNVDYLRTLRQCCEIADHTRTQIKQPDSKISNFISTRTTESMAKLISDGFSLEEIAETTIYVEYTDDSSIDSERTYMRTLIQKYINPTIKKSAPFNSPTPVPL